jgi:HSP20 family protein
MSQQRPTEATEHSKAATQPTEQAKEEKGESAKMERARPQERTLGRTRRHELGAISTSPFSMVRRFMDEMDRIFSDFGFRTPSLLAPLTPLTVTPFPPLPRLEVAVWSPAIETFERDGRLVFRAELPGLDKENVNVEIDGDQLVISGERTESEEQRRGGRVYSERCYGAFERRITLPEGCDLEDVQASFENGVLEVSITVPEEAKPQRRRIQIKGAGEEHKEGEGEPVH